MASQFEHHFLEMLLVDRPWGFGGVLDPTLPLVDPLSVDVVVFYLKGVFLNLPDYNRALLSLLDRGKLFECSGSWLVPYFLAHIVTAERVAHSEPLRQHLLKRIVLTQLDHCVAPVSALKNVPISLREQVVIIWLRQSQQVVMDRKIQSFAPLSNLLSKRLVLYLAWLEALLTTEELLPLIKPWCRYQVVKKRLVAPLNRRCVF